MSCHDLVANKSYEIDSFKAFFENTDYSHCYIPTVRLCSSHKISVQLTGIYFTRDLLKVCSKPPNTQGSLLMEAGV